MVCWGEEIEILLQGNRGRWKLQDWLLERKKLHRKWPLEISLWLSLSMCLLLVVPVNSETPKGQARKNCEAVNWPIHEVHAGGNTFAFWPAILESHLWSHRTFSRHPKSVTWIHFIVYKLYFNEIIKTLKDAGKYS